MTLNHKEKKELVHLNIPTRLVEIVEAEVDRIKKREDLPITKAAVYRKIFEAGLKALGLVALLFSLNAQGAQPIDFGDSETQITILATYAFAHITYQLLRKRAGMAKLPAWIISHVGAASLSLAHDHYADGSRGYISRSKQWGAVMSLSISTVLSIHLFDGGD